MDLYQQQSRNRWATWGLLVAFTALLLVLGVAVHLSMPLEIPVSVGGADVPLPIVPVGVLAFSVVTSWASYFQGDRIVLGAMRARRLNPDSLKERQLQNVAEEMALASGLPVPALYVVPDDDLNAFATGRSPAHASLAVTEGLLDALDREELQAVVAHEMGHIRNLDIRTMTIVGVLLGAVALMGDMLVHMGDSGRNRRKGGGSLPLVLIGFVTPLVARVIATAVSRTREFEADRSAAEFTRNPLALARALDKLEGAKAPTRYASQGSAHMFIVDPRVSSLNDREDWLGDLFATHPPIQVRIKRLQAMGY
ncbi:MAG: M48 family metallopeptidase, partial [Candidatus Sericytochromatia bacterium]